MMSDSFKQRKKFTNDEIIAALSFLDEVGCLSNEDLQKRKLQIGETQKINHFLTAVNIGESTCLPKQASTLLRLTPLLLDNKASNTVHHVFFVAVPRALEAYRKTTDLEEKRSLADAIKIAGMVCMSRRLAPTARERREEELKMFQPFIGDTKEYEDAKARFVIRNHLNKRSLTEVSKMPANATRIYPWGGRYSHGRLHE